MKPATIRIFQVETENVQTRRSGFYLSQGCEERRGRDPTRKG
jgi:hypothetical protein